MSIIMETLTLSTSVYPLLGDEDHNPEKPTARQFGDGNIGDVVRCRTWVVTNTNLGGSLTRIVLDYTFPTAAQTRFVNAYAQLVNTQALPGMMIGNDIAVARLAVMRDGAQLRFARLEQRNNKLVVLDAVRQNGFALQFTGAALKDDEDVVIAAVTQKRLAIRFSGPTQATNPKVLRAAGMLK